MKKRIAFAFVVLLVMSGCTLSTLFNPIVGTWENNTLGIVTKYEFNSNGSSLETITVLSVGVSTAGAWVSDSSTLTMTWVGSPDNQVYLYSFNGDNSIMTLTPSGGGLVRNFARQ
jgi:hypothetical protein